MGSIISDAQQSLRSLLKNRGFAVVALATIALGVGANTAVFSVVNAALIRPLPFPDGDRVVAIYETVQRTALERRAVSYLDFLDWQRELRGIQAISVADYARFTMRVGEAPERLDGELISASYFDVLGVRPAIGRPFSPEDDSPGASAVVLISDALWQRAFNREPSVIGRSVLVDNQAASVVGVMPAGFGGFTDTAQIWAPVTRFVSRADLENRGERWMSVAVARLRPLATVEQVNAELAALMERLAATHRENRDRGAAAVPVRDEYVGDIRPTLLILLGAVGFVLLIACVNVANLLLARGAARRRELAVRTALGAARSRIVRQLLTESITLSVLGGAGGLLAASWGIDLLIGLSPVTLPSFVTVGVDLRVLAFTLAICVASGIVFGAVPAFSVSRTDVVTVLKTGGRDESGGGSTAIRRALVAAEIALAIVLLAGAGLMLRTLRHMGTLDPGFRPHGLVTARLTIPEVANEQPNAQAARTAAFAESLFARLRELPAISAASLASDVPMGTSVSATRMYVDGNDQDVRVYRHYVSPGHFATLGVPLLEGRDFTSADMRIGARRVAVVSHALARRHWPGEDALLKRIRRNDDVYEIVGVVGDVKHRRLLEDETADPDVYLPFSQLQTTGFAVVMRTGGDATEAVAALRRLVTGLNGGVPVFAVLTGDELMAQQLSRARFGSALLGTFALVALALTMIGIYGVTAYTVSRQTRQVGIRMALGATRGDVLRLVVRSGLIFIAAGLAAGIVAALALTRLLSSLIYGVSPTDPMTFGGVVALLAVVALIASLIPAIRATRIDPATALRAD
jgi:putative ABC transport system permease protein